VAGNGAGCKRHERSSSMGLDSEDWDVGFVGVVWNKADEVEKH